jgi:hypothetical protein
LRYSCCSPLPYQHLHITSDPSVIAYDDGTGNYRIYAFARGDHGTLVVDFWSNWANASTWQWIWQDLGVPSGATYINDPFAVTYRGSNGIQYVAVFVETDSGDLAVYHWDGSNWNWDVLSAESIAYYWWAPSEAQHRMSSRIWINLVDVRSRSSQSITTLVVSYMTVPATVHAQRYREAGRASGSSIQSAIRALPLATTRLRLTSSVPMDGA